MITASDQGCVVSVDSGKSWSSWYNQPTGQFYHVAVDDQFPYKIYSGQQDNGTVGILSRGPYGVIEDRDWHPVGGDERDYMVSQARQSKFSFRKRTRRTCFPIRRGHAAGCGNLTMARVELRAERDQREVPLHMAYAAGFFSNRKTCAVFRQPIFIQSQPTMVINWQIISPDLTRQNKRCKGQFADPDRMQARDAGYGVIYSIAPSPISEGVIWVGTDDGLDSIDNGRRETIGKTSLRRLCHYGEQISLDRRFAIFRPRCLRFSEH